jgi:S1-C subfamily serine protease
VNQSTGRSASLPVRSQHRGRRAALGFVLLLLITTGVLVITHGVPTTALRLAPGSSQAASGPGESAPVKRAPSVVKTPVRGPLTAAELTALERKVAPAIVDVTVEIPFQDAVAAGTGIVLSPTGEVLTNNHVINGAATVRVTEVTTGRRYRASVVGYDRAHDIAVLQMHGASSLRTALLGDSDTVQIGNQVVAIGNAGGKGGRPDVAAGPVTNLGRTISTSDEPTGGSERLTDLVQAGANIRPGDSGGALVDDSGRVIGVNVAASVDAQTQRPNGTGFAIPINIAMSVVHQIRAGAASDAVHIGATAQLGVVVNGVSDRARHDALAELQQLQPETQLPDTGPSTIGAFVADVMFGSPAEQAGIRPGDVVTTLNGSGVDSADALVRVLGTARPGDRIALGWVDLAGRRRNASVALAAGPPN